MTDSDPACGEIDAGVDESKVVSVPVGVDTELFSYDPLTACGSKKPVNFIFVGRATAVKVARAEVKTIVLHGRPW